MNTNRHDKMNTYSLDYILKQHKVFLLLSLWSLLIVHDLSAQQYDAVFEKRAIYTLISQLDSLDPNSVVTTTWYLLLNDKESLFQEAGFVVADSVDFVHSEKDAVKPKTQGVPISPVKKDRYKIMKNADSIIVYDEVVGRDIYGYNRLYRYHEMKADLPWELTGDTAEFAGQHCQVATVYFGGRKWTAYFAPDIPLDDGPYKFCGLPGLIVKIHDEKNYWVFDLQVFETLPVPRRIVTNFQNTYVHEQGSKADFFNIRRNFQNSMIPLLESEGTTLDKDVKERLEKRMQKDNNWIELYP